MLEGKFDLTDNRDFRTDKKDQLPMVGLSSNKLFKPRANRSQNLPRIEYDLINTYNDLSTIHIDYEGGQHATFVYNTTTGNLYAHSSSTWNSYNDVYSWNYDWTTSSSSTINFYPKKSKITATVNSYPWNNEKNVKLMKSCIRKCWACNKHYLAIKNSDTYCPNCSKKSKSLEELEELPWKRKSSKSRHSIMRFGYLPNVPWVHTDEFICLNTECRFRNIPWFKKMSTRLINSYRDELINGPEEEKFDMDRYLNMEPGSSGVWH